MGSHLFPSGAASQSCTVRVYPYQPTSLITRHPSYISIIFAAQAGLQSLSMQDLDKHPFEGEISYRAGLQTSVGSSTFPPFDTLFRFKALGNQEAYDAAVQFDLNMRDTPIDLLHEMIRCRMSHQVISQNTLSSIVVLVRSAAIILCCRMYRV
jgi:hypothetical protein